MAICYCSFIIRYLAVLYFISAFFIVANVKCCFDRLVRVVTLDLFWTCITFQVKMLMCNYSLQSSKLLNLVLYVSLTDFFVYLENLASGKSYVYVEAICMLSPCMINSLPS